MAMKYMSIDCASDEWLELEEDPLLLKKRLASSSSSCSSARRGGGGDDAIRSGGRGGRMRRRRLGACCCRCALIAVASLLAATAVASVVAYRRISALVRDVTVATDAAASSSSSFPVVDMSEGEMVAMRDRAMLFVDRLRFGETTNTNTNTTNTNTTNTTTDFGGGWVYPMEDLIVTQDEINGLIGRSDVFRGRAYVTLGEGWMREEHVLPADGFPGGSGRSFAGDGHLRLRWHDDRVVAEVTMETSAATRHDRFDGPVLFARLLYFMDEKGSPGLYLTSGSIFGYEVPREYIDRRRNILEDLYDAHDGGDEDSSDGFGREDVRAVLDGIEYVGIHPGKIVFHPRKQNGI